jgi:hypothetical protein
MLPKNLKVFLYNKIYFFGYPILKFFLWDPSKFIMPGNCRDDNLIVSLTTNPKRIKSSVPLILENISKCVKEIHINLPRLYRNKLAYCQNDIKYLLEKYDNVKVFYFDYDTGPILKILPTLKRFLGTKYTVISIDDDSWYANTTFLNVPFRSICSGTITESLGLEMPNGVETISYPMPLISLKFIEFLEKTVKDPNCKLHDDFCIAAAIEYNRIPLIQRPIYKFPCTESFSDNNALIYEDRSTLTHRCNAYVTLLK